MDSWEAGTSFPPCSPEESPVDERAAALGHLKAQGWPGRDPEGPQHKPLHKVLDRVPWG